MGTQSDAESTMPGYWTGLTTKRETTEKANKALACHGPTTLRVAARLARPHEGTRNNTVGRLKLGSLWNCGHKGTFLRLSRGKRLALSAIDHV